MFFYIELCKMSSLRNNKNIQSSVASGVFVGLRAEHSHITELHATKLHSDNDQSDNVFDTVRDLKTQCNELQQKFDDLLTKVTNLKLKDLVDVNVETVSSGDALVFQDDKWQPAELSS